MRYRAVALMAAAVFACGVQKADAASPSEEELARTRQWMSDHLLTPTAGYPFSFVYDGRHSEEFLTDWRRDIEETNLEDGRLRYVILLADPGTGLALKYTAVHYVRHAAVELLLEFRNDGDKDTPLLESARPLDLRVPAAGGSCFVHHAQGESNSDKSFAPATDILSAESSGPLVIAPRGGRSSDEHMPFFNLECAGQGGVVAIGWAGQWQARFEYEDEGFLHAEFGLETMQLRLHPGETIRTPRVLIQFWKGNDPLRGNNLFRQWMLAHSLPRRNGDLVQPPICASVTAVDPDGSYEGPHVRAMKPLAECGIEAFWSDMDPQQWYPKGFPDGTGTWEPDPAKYPNGLKPIGQAAHAAALQYLLWFEPERVAPGTRIDELHPEWVTQGKPFHLFKLHIPEARAWLTDYIDKQITEAGVDWLRWDFNIEPLEYWRKNDEPDRQGMTEIRHVEGLYAMWEELMRRHPGLLIDICASGGRRIDFETLRYGLPLWHSDLQCFGPSPAADQLQNGGLFRWVPLHGCGNFDCEPSYVFRSAMTSGNILIRADAARLAADPETQDAVKRSVALYKKLRPYMLGDFYPLFPHIPDETAWYGYQFHRPDLNAGYALVFRRKDGPDTRMELGLKGLSPGHQYEVTYEDQPDRKEVPAERLQAFPVDIPAAPGSAIIYYRGR